MIPFSLHLPWCHFCSPELARLPRVPLKKWVSIIYQGIFQLLSNLPQLVLLFFPLFLSCLVPALHLSSTQGFPLLLREVCFPNHFPAPHPLPFSITPSVSFSPSPPSPWLHLFGSQFSLALNHCVFPPLKTWKRLFLQTARSDLLAGSTAAACLSPALLHTSQRQRHNFPGAEPPWLAAERLLCGGTLQT